MGMGIKVFAAFGSVALQPRAQKWHSPFQPDLISLVLKLPRAAGLAAPFPSDEVVAIIEEEFGWSLRNIFAYLSMEAVAAASFGQVYRGCTIDGLEVAVKAVT
ncbi:unnamed protein product [Sphagnum troendelagicum]